ncbi:PAS domain S-box protein [Aggregicoccus sp. 17bor-14]|uniref:sensor histidine kinase n=1 Tax=Myxococcaceae TaxID=31 RepID=UPI00129CAF09|nr:MULTISPECIES: ATP-binding protein [Myxococcaceae]MBF5046609.1 PAS domain-containing sensor histidine kinase [Simulacricoccus sp. 17bor-14]MRI92320.1 PAS domain S-box protein [Aggregicoccus sp. 17bor-14]
MPPLSPAQPLPEREEEASRLVRRWLKGYAAGMVALTAFDLLRVFALGISTAQPLALDALALATGAAALLLLRRGALKAAVGVFGVGLMVVVALSAALFPDLDLVALLLVPPALVAELLPYYRRGARVAFTLSAFVLQVYVALQLVRHVPLGVVLPEERIIFVLLVALGAGMLLAVLPQYSERLRVRLERLHRSEERFRCLAEAGSLLVWRADARGRIRVEPARWSALTGLAAQPGRVRQAIHPEDLPELRRAWLRTVSTRGSVPFRQEFRLRLADGSWRWVHNRAQAVGEAGGGVREWVGVMMDIEDRKAAEGRLRFLVAASARLAEASDGEDLEGRAVELAAEGLAEGACLEVWAEDGAAPPHVRCAGAHPQALASVLRERAGGRGGGAGPPGDAGEPGYLGDLPYLALPLAVGGRGLGVLHLVRGRPAQAFTPDALELAREFAYRVALALDAAQLRERLEASVQLRDEFLQVAAHELRTPLTPLRLHLASWRRHHPELNVEPLERQVRHLNDLVEAMLDLSRVRGGQLVPHLEPVDLAALVRATAARFLQAEVGGRRSPSEVRLQLPERLQAVSDPGRLGQVLRHLLSNAIKYGEARPVHVRLAAEGPDAVLQVQDEGMGIPPERQARIFEAFERAVPVEHFGGLGLGLYLARETVGALGGSIAVQSEPGRGALFTVRLPLAGPPGVEAGTGAAPPAEQPPAGQPEVV